MSGMSDVIVVAVAGCTACPPRCTSLDAGNVCSCWRRIGLPRTRHPTPLVAYVHAGPPSESIAMWHRIADLVGDDCGFQEVGQVKVAENDTEMQTLREREKTMRAAGREHEEVVDAAALRRLSRSMRWAHLLAP